MNSAKQESLRNDCVPYRFQNEHRINKCEDALVDRFVLCSNSKETIWEVKKCRIQQYLSLPVTLLDQSHYLISYSNGFVVSLEFIKKMNIYYYPSTQNKCSSEILTQFPIYVVFSETMRLIWHGIELIRRVAPVPLGVGMCNYLCRWHEYCTHQMLYYRRLVSTRVNAQLD